MNKSPESTLRGDFSRLQSRVPVVEKLTPEYFEQEREKIFRRAWMPIVHTADVPDKGSYRVIDMPTFRTSLLIIRGQDDRVRAFHNICMHRGNKLIRSGEGCRSSFSCGFHGWTYSPEGALLLVTDEYQFRDLDKSALGLRAVTTEVWEGILFANFDDQPRQSLGEWLGEFFDQYQGYFQTHEKIGSYRVELDCNWNLGVNSFNEGYHTLYLHHNTAPDYQGGASNPQRHRPFIELFDRHRRYSAPANPDHRPTPAEVVAFNDGRRKFLPAFDCDSSGLPPGVNPSRYDKWAFDVITFFPNFVVLAEKNWHIELWFWPVDAGRTVILQDVYAYPAKTPAERISQEFFISRGRQVFLEDLNTLEANQEMLMSGALTHFQLSLQEVGLQHHYQAAAEMLEQA